MTGHLNDTRSIPVGLVSLITTVLLAALIAGCAGQAATGVEGSTTSVAIGANLGPDSDQGVPTTFVGAAFGPAWGRIPADEKAREYQERRSRFYNYDYDDYPYYWY